MATLSWTASTSGLWTNALNWSSDQVPGAGETALVTLAGNYLVNVLGSVTVGSLVLDDAGAEIGVGGSLSVTGSLTVATGLLNVGGSLDAAGLSNAGIVDNSGSLDVGALSNTGSIDNSGTLDISALTNSGSIDNTGILELTGSVLSNPGTINNTGAVFVSGSVVSAPLARIGGSGEIFITGTVDNAGGTLGANGPIIQSDGLIEGGTIVNTNLTAGSTIEGVTVQGIFQAFGSITIVDGLTGVGSGGLGALSFISGVTVDFANVETLANLGLSGDGTIIADSTLTIDSNVLMTADGGTNPSLPFDGTGTVINGGTLLAVSVAEGNALIAIQNADFENSGVLSAADNSQFENPDLGINEGTAELDIAAGTFMNHAGGIIETGQAFGIGFVTIAAGTDFTNDGTLSTRDPTTSAGGTIDIAAFVHGSGTIEINGGGYVTLESPTSSTQIIDFLGAGTLMLDQPTLVPAAIEGFNTADAIVLSGVSATAISYTSGDLKLQTSTGTLDLAITGGYTLSDFQVVAQSNDTTIALGSLPCLAAGSRVATDRGAVRVERLRVGDVVMTASGERQTIEWIGHRDVDCGRHPDPEAVWPIRIAPHAFGQGQPRRTLLLSPDHAVFVDDVLVPIKYLVNGTTIVRRKVARITYYHVELRQHDILLAEGLPVESYLETGGRAAFANGGGVMQLHSDFAPDPVRIALIWDSEGYAPLTVAPAQLAPIRARLRCQAEALHAARQAGKGKRRASNAG
jgi:hypothetical protein